MKLPYRSEIDGLRTIAVLSVILYHAQIVVFGHDFFKGGFVGVDIFFVISGYLISRILLSELFEKGKISFLQFYERRARRILPILFTVFLVLFPLAYKYLLPNQFIEYAQSILSATFFGSNIFFYFTNTQYGAEDSLLQPFLHTWSLGVEEQFYILFPIVLLLAYKFAKNHLVTIITILILISLTHAHWQSTKNIQLNFFMLTSRLWELGIGSLLAFYELKYGRVKNELLNQTMPLFGLAMIAHVVVFFNNQTPHPSFMTLLPTLGTALIILYSTNKTDILSKILSLKPIVGIGLISYSMYLWHYPIFAFARIADTNGLHNDEKYLLILLTIILSIFSYFIIEKPFRNNQFVNMKKFSVAIFILLIAVLTINYMVIDLKGLKERLSNNFFQSSQNIDEKFVESKAKDNYENLDIPKIILESIGKTEEGNFDNEDCIFWSKEFNYSFNNRFNKCREKYKKGIFIIGDSHAINLFQIFAQSNMYDFVASVSQGSCRPHGCFTKQNHYRVFMDDFVKSLDKNISVIYHQSGSYFMLDKENNNDSQKTFDENFYKVDYENLDIVRKFLNIVSEKIDSNLIWIGPFTEYRFDPKKIIRLQYDELIKKLNINEASIQFFKKLENDIGYFLDGKDKKFKYISFEKIYDIKSQAILRHKNGYCFQFNDTDHFSKCGTEIAAKNLKDSKFYFNN
jgi:peptidoglycan/LPS O-acetylase OafA/YrhL